MKGYVMEVLLSIMSQITVTADSESEYEDLRDELLSQLERLGYSVNIMSEESDDGWFSELEESEDNDDDDSYYDVYDEGDDDDIDEDENY